MPVVSRLPPDCLFECTPGIKKARLQLQPGTLSFCRCMPFQQTGRAIWRGRRLPTVHLMNNALLSQSSQQALFRKISWRLLPFLTLCYTFAYLDRINIGFAKIQMQADIGLSDAAYGLGAGIFFLSYMLFEIPSNLLFPRLGARRTFSRILILWGLTSA